MGLPDLCSKLQPQLGLLARILRNRGGPEKASPLLHAPTLRLAEPGLGVQDPQLLVRSLLPQTPRVSRLSSVTGTSTGPEGSLSQTRFRWALAE